jgi:hypothetical protein
MCRSVCRYKLVHKIPITLGLADGRFTTVWLAKDTTTNRDVVVKVSMDCALATAVRGLLVDRVRLDGSRMLLAC